MFLIQIINSSWGEVVFVLSFLSIFQYGLKLSAQYKRPHKTQELNPFKLNCT